MLASPRFRYNGRDWPLLSANSKMDCYSWSLPAVFTCPGMRARKGDICSACYARIGRYAMPTVAEPQAARLAWTIETLADDPRRWVDAMANAIECSGNRFRWHDSGDVFSASYARALVRVSRATPHVRQWAPTRSWRVKELLPHLRRWHRLGHVNVTPSAVAIGDAPPVVRGLGAGQTVHLGDAPDGCRDCPKEKAGSCSAAGCFDCWARDSEPVSFHVHGHAGTQRATPPSDSRVRRHAETVRQFVPLRIEVAQ